MSAPAGKIEPADAQGVARDEEGALPGKVICFLFDPNTGGPTIRARMVYQRMTARGCQVRMALPDLDGSAAGYLTEGGLAVDRLRMAKPVPPSKPLRFLGFCLASPVSIWTVRRYLKRHRPDVVHVNGAFDVVPALGARLAGVPLVWHLNDTVFGPGVSRWLGRMVRAVAAQVVTAADRVADHYAIPRGQYVTIHAPVDVERFAPRAVPDGPEDPPRLLLIGNWNWIKAQDRFIDVIGRLRADGVDARGRIAGRFLESQESFWRPIVDDLKASGLDSVIETPGFVDTRTALGASDLLLLTSHSEASPIAVLEAMSVGVPVVTFDVGGVREMLGEGDGAAGIVVAPGDVGAMTRAVAGLLGDPGRYGWMVRNGQARARAHFSAEACVARHADAYRRAMNAGQASGEGAER